MSIPIISITSDSGIVCVVNLCKTARMLLIRGKLYVLEPSIMAIIHWGKNALARVVRTHTDTALDTYNHNTELLDKGIVTAMVPFHYGLVDIRDKRILDFIGVFEGNATIRDVFVALSEEGIHA